MEAREVSYLMDLNESGVITYDNRHADLNNLAEWLDTPRGSIYGVPEWGNELANFKHEPTGSMAVAIAIEFSVIKGVMRDLPNIVIDSIYCEPSKENMDLYLVRVGLGGDFLEKDLT